MTEKLPMPQAGGSYRRLKDGSLERVAHTINVGEPGHPDQGPAGAAELAAKPARKIVEAPPGAAAGGDKEPSK